MTLREIATKMHEGEDTGDDAKFMEAQDALEAYVREAGPKGHEARQLFRDVYRDIWRERMGDA